MAELIAVIRKDEVEKLMNMKTAEIVDEMFIAKKRDEVEEDENFVQPIPYAAVFDSDGKIFVYRRGGGEKRLEGKLSIGVGGHMRPKERVFDTLMRELSEELGIVQKEVTAIKFLGTYYRGDSDQQVDRVHLGLMFAVKLSGSWLEIVNNEEIVGKFKYEITPEEYEQLELWSKALLSMITGEKK